MRLVAFEGHHEGQVECEDIVGPLVLEILADDHLEHLQELSRELGLVRLGRRNIDVT